VTTRLREICSEVPAADFARLVADITAIRVGQVAGGRPPEPLIQRGALNSLLVALSARADDVPPLPTPDSAP